MKYGNATLGQVEAVWNKLGGEEGVKRFLADKVEIVMKSILTFVRTVVIPAQSAVTTSKQYFWEAGVKSLGNNFESQFLGLEVGAVEETTLSIHKLNEASLDEPILTELGDKAEITPSQFKKFLSENKKSGEYFLFCMKGRDGELWAVSAYWSVDNDGWDVNADSVRRPGRWDAGYQVVSRN